jgi:hypothetical protein
LAVGLLSFVGFLDVCARLPLEIWASLLLSGGLAIQSARLVGRRRRASLELVRWTTPLLAGALLAVMLLTIGRRAWSEHRALAALPPPPPAAHNVLLIVWDTVRAGNLSLYGYGRPTTPHLARFAGRGVRFDLAFSTSSWTLPSHASLFTGRWPHELGVDWSSPLRADVPTLAEYLGSRGYDTAGFVANLDYCSRETGSAWGIAWMSPPGPARWRSYWRGSRGTHPTGPLARSNTRSAAPRWTVSSWTGCPGSRVGVARSSPS